MRFLADENIPGDAVQALRAMGHDVAWVLADAPASRDVDVLARAMQENRVVLTFDKDFGERAWRSRLPAACGIILLRIPMPTPAAIGARIAAIVGMREDWGGHFAVVEPGRIRMRPLPKEP